MLYTLAPEVRSSTFDYLTIDQFNILKFTPDTLPVGGVIPPQCFECSLATNAHINKQLLDILFGKFEALRISYHAEKDERKKLEVKLQISTCKKRIDKAIEELTAYQTTAGKKW
ncbi:hypothetical protein J7T55_014469 [Diaporthe amygdali]|uniref:uncharacterized protein n=1 Tax=Phomopsis amygdali TaxID=1214568 RepID=UPI0022FE92CD|nr:uncharacterized protein J7T55_014469 [Diaporthe amygdali]KAJ0118016.1 hypothetical protein J7T55_014469 [Diaporthe amygdali]